MWREADVNAEQNLRYHQFTNAMFNFWLSQYWILRFILSSVMKFQQTIALFSTGASTE